MTRMLAPLGVAALTLACLAGCASNDADAPVEPASTAGDASQGPAPRPPAPGTLTEDQIETIRMLPEEEAELALVQKLCPVTDEPLGSMGVPAKLVVNGRDVFVCCIGCKGAVDEDPEGILAKVPQGGPELPSMGGAK